MDSISKHCCLTLFAFSLWAVAVVIGTNWAVSSLGNLKLFALADLNIWWNTWTGVSQQHRLETAVDTTVGPREWSNWPFVN